MTRPALPVVTDGDAVLRPLQRDDLGLTLGWRNDPETRRWFHRTEPIPEAGHLAWFERYLQRDDDLVFVLDVGGVPVGQAGLAEITREDAEFGRLLVDPARRGTGLSHRLIALCLRVADEDLRLSRLHLEVKPGNAPALRAYERAGFVRVEGATGTAGSVVMERRLR